jgi:hypothetical protein
LGLPPQASAGEIERVFLEQRAEAEKRLRQGDVQARADIERLERAFRLLESAVGTTEPVPVERPEPIRRVVSPPLTLRWESTGSLVCGVLACLTVLWFFYAYRSDLNRPSIDLLWLLQKPAYFFIFLLALAAEVLSHTDLLVGSRALILARKGPASQLKTEQRRISRARLGRRFGRLAAASAFVLALLMTFSFFHAIGQRP